MGEVRVAELERQLANCKAQLEASTIFAEQTSQSMEKRYQRLLEKHGQTAAEKDSLLKENDDLQKSVTEAKQESHKLQSSLMKAESEKEQHKLEIDSLERDKVSLQNAYEQSKKDIEELQSKIRTVSTKVLNLTKENGELDARLQSTLAEKSRTSLNYSKIEQEKKILEKSNAWLSEELERKAQASNEERQKATQKIVELQNQCYESQSKIEQLENDKGRLEADLQDHEESLKTMSKQLREAKEALAEKEESFQQELALAQRMAQLYKESSEEHTKRSMELEGIVNELKVHMEESAEAHREAIAKLEEECRTANQRAEEEKDIREKVVAAAATASFSISTPAGTDNGAAQAADQPQSSSAEIYARFIEAEEKLRAEKLKNREKEIHFEDLLIEVEKRASLLKEQQLEFDSMKASHVKLLGDIESLSAEKRRIQSSLKETQGKCKTLEHENLSLEQQVKDLGQQVSRLLHEGQKNKISGERTPGNFTGGNASDVTTQFLVEFSSVEELQQQNQKLLKVNRELAVAAEATKEAAQKEMQEEYEGKIEKLRNDLEDLKRNRQHAEEIFEQVVRQRDTLRKLLQNAGGDLSIGRELYARSGGNGAGVLPQASNTENVFTSEADSLTYKEMYEDMEKKLEDFKKRSNEDYAALEKELASSKGDLISLKKEVTQAQAQCQYESERSTRLSKSIESQQKHVESLLASNAKYQALINETERRLSSAQHNLQAIEDDKRSLSNKVASLEAEKKVLIDAEQRLTAETSALSQEKFKIAAELDVLRKQNNELESNALKDISKNQTLATKYMNELSDAQRELSVAKSRAEYAHNEVAHLKQELAKTSAKLEEKLEKAQTELSRMQQRASAAEAKADLLQEAVRKSEEKVARLEIEKNARLPASQSEQVEKETASEPQDADLQVKELQSEIKILREELVAAQEALAASTGHAKQFETIAHTAEEALKSSQTEYEKFRREAANRLSSIEAEVKRLRMEITKKDIAIKELKQEETKAHQECDKLRHEIEIEKNKSKREVELSAVSLNSEKEKVLQLTKEVDAVRKEIDEVKKAYDDEVVAHGDAIRRLTASESTVHATQNRLNAVSDDLEKERASRKLAETEMKATIVEQTQQVQQLTKQVEQLSKHRDTLQQELESIAESKDPSVTNLSKSMKLLRQEREAAELNLSLSERELSRLRQENAVAKRAAEEARAQLSAEIERQAKKKTEEQQNQIGLAEQISLTRESNMALRADNTDKQAQIDSLQAKLKNTEASIEPLKLEIKRKEAEMSNLEEKLHVQTESAKRWEARSKSLAEKSRDAENADYEQTKAELSAKEKELNAVKSELASLTKEKEKLEVRLKNSETIALKANAKATGLTKQMDEMRKRAEVNSKSTSELSKKQQEEKDGKIAELTNQKKALEEKVKELSKKEEVLKANARKLISNCEAANQAKKKCDSQVKLLRGKIQSLESEIRSLKSKEGSGAQVVSNVALSDTQPALEALGKRKADSDMDAPEKANKKLRPVAPSFTPSKLTSATDQNEKVKDVQAGGEGEKEMVDTQEVGAAVEASEAKVLPEKENEATVTEKIDVPEDMEEEPEHVVLTEADTIPENEKDSLKQTGALVHSESIPGEGATQEQTTVGTAQMETAPTASGADAPMVTEDKAKDERPTEAPLEAQHPVLGEEQQQDEKVLEEPEATVIPQVENAGETDVHAAEDKSLINEEVNAEVEKKPAEEEEKPVEEENKPAEEEKKPAEEEEKKPAEEDDQKPESPKKPKQAKKRTKILWKDTSKQ
ncbi:hypothetical protein M9435_005510 [Picochlorum sp. BPE23]|nr:hypothetical protein M9435_005510 [Picochlorum sp. BPE23]